MTEPGNSVPTERDDEPAGTTSYGLAPAFGDPGLELFGQGRNPDPEPTPPIADTYAGRHRAPEA